MKAAKRGLVVGALAFLVVACRAIVGIEDQTVGDAGPGPGGPDGGGGGDAKSDATTIADAKPDVDLGDASVCKATSANFQQCGMCCNSNFQPQFIELFKAARMNGCICGGSSNCQTECSTTTGDCGGTGMTPPSMTCAPCLDDAVAHALGSCGTVTCNSGGLTCDLLVACLRSCL